MYSAGELVVYGFHGVCRVLGVEHQRRAGSSMSFLVLVPVEQEGSRYLVPYHNEAAMAKVRPVMCPEALEQLFRSERVQSGGWISDENIRKLRYRELITSGDPEALMQMLFTLYQHHSVKQAAGRRLHLADENFLKDAEKQLASEISVVLKISEAEARAYLQEKLNN